MSDIHVVAGIVWKNGKYLAARRPEGFPRAGLWEFPGGKIEHGETQEEALVREFIEEMNIRPTKFSFWQTVHHEYPEFKVTLYFFHITAYEGILAPQEGHDIQWLSHAEAVDMPFLAADMPLISQLRDCPHAI